MYAPILQIRGWGIGLFNNIFKCKEVNYNRMKYLKKLCIVLVFFVFVPSPVWAGLKVVTKEQAEIAESKKNLDTIDFLWVRNDLFYFNEADKLKN